MSGNCKMLHFSNSEAAKSKFWAEIPGKLAEIPGKWAEIPVRHESNLHFFYQLGIKNRNERKSRQKMLLAEKSANWRSRYNYMLFQFFNPFCPCLDPKFYPPILDQVAGSFSKALPCNQSCCKLGIARAISEGTSVKRLPARLRSRSWRRVEVS